MEEFYDLTQEVTDTLLEALDAHGKFIQLITAEIESEHAYEVENAYTDYLLTVRDEEVLLYDSLVRELGVRGVELTDAQIHLKAHR